MEGKKKWTRPNGLRKRSMRTNAMFEKIIEQVHLRQSKPDFGAYKTVKARFWHI